MVPAARPQIGILTGPTATGKTAIALEFARARNATTTRSRIEIINADSMLVYRGMDIGTAKPTAEERAEIPHHLIDIKEPAEDFTAGDFVRSVQSSANEIHGRGARALIVGGTGFYLKALLFGLWEAVGTDEAFRASLDPRSNAELHAELEHHDPQSAIRIGANDRYRLVRALELIHLSGKTPTALQAEQPKEPNPDFKLWILDRANDELYPRIEKRTKAMLSQGFVEEVKSIRARAPRSRALEAVGYAQVCDYLDGVPPEGRKIEPGLAGLEEEITLATRQLVKRQRTWYRGFAKLAAAETFTLDADLEKLKAEMEQIYGS